MSRVDLLSSVGTERLVDILRKNWMSHDARWQMAVFQTFGPEKGNRLNQTVVRDMGKTMMFRLMGALGISQVRSVEELEGICLAAMKLYFPPPAFTYHFERLSDASLLGVVENCGTYENVKKAGVLDFYECGCLAMRSGWYDALGIEAKEELGKCLKKGDKACEIIIRVNKWKR